MTRVLPSRDKTVCTLIVPGQVASTWSSSFSMVGASRHIVNSEGSSEGNSAPPASTVKAIVTRDSSSEDALMSVTGL